MCVIDPTLEVDMKSEAQGGGWSPEGTCPEGTGSEERSDHGGVPSFECVQAAGVRASFVLWVLIQSWNGL